MKKLSAVSVAHFCVDLCCAALFFGWAGHQADWWLSMILYNACAFALQLPLGILSDEVDKNLPFAAAGCALVAVSFLLIKAPLLASVVSGLGNGMFHVGAGREVLSSSHSAAPLGVFVSPGAIGLYLGTAYAPFLSQLFWALPLLMILMGGWLLALRKATDPSPARQTSPALLKGDMLPLVSLFGVVVLRSLLSGGAFSSKIENLPGLVPVLCLALGKAAGGFLRDKLRLRQTAILSLIASALLLLLPRGYGTLLSLFLFNMTMPLTLFEAARLLPKARGTAFGMLTCALFVGMLPAFSGLSLHMPQIAWAALVLLSLGLLLMGLKREKAHG